MSVSELESLRRSYEADRYLGPVKTCLDNLIEYGKDRYGRIHSPIWMAVIDVDSLEAPRSPKPCDEAVRVQRRGRRAPGGSNLYMDQPMIRAALKLSDRTGDEKYARAVAEYATYYLRHFLDPQTGLIEWGWHNYYDAYEDAIEYLEGHHHEIHIFMPVWPALYRCAPDVIEREIAQIWEWHVDHETGQFGRHPDRGLGCSFAMTGGEFVLAFAFMHSVTEDPKYLAYARKVANRHWEARHRESNLIPNQVEREEYRFDCVTCDTSISGLWCSRLLAASVLAGAPDLLDMACRVLVAFSNYGWNDDNRPHGLLNLDGSPVPGPRATDGYEQWAPKGPLDLWPAYVCGYEFPQETAMTQLMAYRLTRDPLFLSESLRWAGCFASDLDLLRAKGTYAQHYGMVISFLVELFKESGDLRWLHTALAFADQAIEQLWNGKLFRGHPQKPYYEAVDGVGFLCYSLIQLTDALKGSGESRSEKTDPFEWNL